MTTDLTARFLAQMQQIFPGDAPDNLGVALSGGGDSVALLVLLAAWAKKSGTVLHAITVDHGLRRPAAATEALAAKAHCTRLGVAHVIIRWRGWTGQGNLQDAARQARKKLIANWAQSNAIQTVAVGHTADDQAETLLMRLARGSGVDGLSAMARTSHSHGVKFIRPLLSHRRADLRQYLRALGLSWTDDPSNDDTRFDRIKARRALAGLQDIGIDVHGLVQTTDRMRSTRDFLEYQLATLARAASCVTALGDVLIDRDNFATLHSEMQQRLMVHALKWVSSTPYRPRQSSLAEVLSAVARGQAKTLAGCRIACEKDGSIRVFREYQAVKTLKCPGDAIWDARWRASGLSGEGFEIKALGKSGLAECPDWRQSGHPYASLLPSPAIFRHGEVIATVFAEISTTPQICLINGPKQYYSAAITH